METLSAVGQDSHRFTEEEKPLYLGGVLFEGCRGLAANSDGDVVLHAITNAVSGLTGVNILGEAADALCRNGITDSAVYLREALNVLEQKNMRLRHISLSLECKAPKISPKTEEMRLRIAGLCGISPERIGITATSGEGLTEFGRGEGIAVICVVIPVLALAIGLIIFAASPRYTRMQASLDGLNNRIDETITNERVIKSFVREDYEKEKFSRINDVLMEKSIAALELMILLQPVSALAVNITTLAVVWIAGRQIMIGAMEIGTLTAFITYLTQILTALNFMANIVLQGTRAAASDRRITQIMEAEVDLTDEHASARDLTIQRGEIEFRHVSMRYFKQNREKVLDDVSFTAAEGEVTALVGPSGSGKSTCAKLAARLWDIDEGTIKVGGVDISTVDPEVLLTDYSVVFQDVVLFDDTVMENIRLGKHGASDEEVLAAAKAANCDEFVARLPEGYNTSIGENGAKLSGGERQRISIARALLKDAPIILLDEATASLDVENETKVQGALSRLLRGKTVLVIAHRMRTVEAADKIIVLKEGRVAEEGTPADLMKKGGLFERMVELQKQSAGWKLK